MVQVFEKLVFVRSKTKQKREHTHKDAKIFLVILMVPVLTTIVYLAQSFQVAESMPMKGGYVIQNLRGDVTSTWLAWNIVEGRELQIQIVDQAHMSNEELDAVKNAILSTKTIELDDSLLHKGPAGFTSTYYEGWKGAAMAASQTETMFYIPTEFKIVNSKKGIADITIILTELKSGDGYSGFTKSISDDNHILMSQITIYDADKLTTQEIATIVRHEFGHALGLAHSTATEDLMAPTIQTGYPYISGCDVDALRALYDGNKQSQVVCEK